MCKGQVKPITLCKRQRSVISLKDSFGLCWVGQLGWPCTPSLHGRNLHRRQYQTLVANPTFNSHYLTKSLHKGQPRPLRKESRLFNPVSKSNKAFFSSRIDADHTIESGMGHLRHYSTFASEASFAGFCQIYQSQGHNMLIQSPVLREMKKSVYMISIC